MYDPFYYAPFFWAGKATRPVEAVAYEPVRIPVRTG